MTINFIKKYLSKTTAMLLTVLMILPTPSIVLAQPTTITGSVSPTETVTITEKEEEEETTTTQQIDNEPLLPTITQQEEEKSTEPEITTEAEWEEEAGLYKIGEILIQYDKSVFNKKIEEIEATKSLAISFDRQIEEIKATKDSVADFDKKIAEIEAAKDLSIKEIERVTKTPIAVADEFAKSIGIEKPVVKDRIESFNTEVIDIGENSDPLEVIEKLNQATSTKGIVLAQPNYIYRLQSSDWDTDPERYNSWHLKAIQLWDAWGVVDNNNSYKPITIGIIDSGIDFNNQDIDSRKWSATTCLDEEGVLLDDSCDKGGYDFLGHDNDPSPLPTGGGQHGTKVASVVAGEYENGYGVIGIAKDGVELVGIRVSGRFPLVTSANLVKAINFARHNQIDIINISLGVGRAIPSISPYKKLKSCEYLEYQALEDYGTSTGSWSGGLAVMVAGNEDVESGGADNRVFIPGDYSTTVHINGEKCWDSLDNVISVGGTQLNEETGREEMWHQHKNDDDVNNWGFIADSKWANGNENNFVGTTRGNHITVTAPAYDIPASTKEESNSNNPGTSFAAPQVTGVAALMLRVNPDLTPGQIKQKIKDSADIVTDLYDANVANGRRLNAYRAVKAALPDSTSIPPQLDPLPKIKINENEDPLESFIDYVGTAYKKGWTDSDGDGLIEIATRRQLNNIRYNLSGTSYKTHADDDRPTVGCGLDSEGNQKCRGYELVDDINLALHDDSDTIFTYNKGWIPIGDKENPFTGTFDGIKPDGSNYTIKNLKINNSKLKYAGLFGYIEDADINNLTLRKVDINANNYVGSLVGLAKNSSITNIKLTNKQIKVEGKNNVGGLIGKTDDTNLNNIFITGKVKGKNSVGGFIGIAKDTIITKVEINNQTIGKNNVGGLIGRIEDSTVSISNSFVKGKVSLTLGISLAKNIAGFVGLVGGDVIITDSYGIADVPNRYGYDWYDKIENGKTATINDSYYSSSAAKNLFNDNGRTNKQLKAGEPTSADASQPIFVGWNENIWNFGKSDEYPYTRENYQSLKPTALTDLTVVPGNRHLDVSWSRVPGVNVYRVEWKPTGDDGDWNIKRVTTNGTRISDLVNNVEYTLQVKSKNNHDSSAYVTAVGTPFNHTPTVGGTDEDGDGLIEIANATELQNITYSIGTNGYMDGPYKSAVTTGCPAGVCRGFELKNNINLSGIDFTSIATAASPFDAIFDGNGHTISGLNIDEADSKNIGLFRHTNGATIKNLILGDTNVVGQRYVGALIGTAKDTTIDRVGVNATVNGNRYIGGMIGATKGEVSITNSYVNGNVSQTNTNAGAGGLIGYLQPNTNVNVNKTYGKAVVGGSSGYDWYGDANSSADSNFLYSYYETNTASNTRDTTKQRSATELKSGTPLSDTIFTNWSTNKWDFGTDSEYPYLIWASGGGTDSDNDGLVEIATLKQLGDIRDNLTATTSISGCPYEGCHGFELVNDLDFKDSEWVNDINWTPIGNGNTAFVATFEGNNHTISNLTINSTTADRVGLFGKTDYNAIIKNLTLENANVTGDNYVGTLIGMAKDTTIEQIGIDTRVDGHQEVGGMIGRIHKNVTIKNSYVAGAVDPDSNANSVGGLIGHIYRYYGEPQNYITDTYGTAVVRQSNGYDWYGSYRHSSYKPTFTNSYYSDEAIGSTRHSAGVRTNAELKTGTPTDADDDNPIYVDWDENIWDFGDDDEYPVFE